MILMLSETLASPACNVRNNGGAYRGSCPVSAVLIAGKTTDLAAGIISMPLPRTPESYNIYQKNVRCGVDHE